MTSVPAVPEFRETDQYWKPLLTHGVDIIRPKPRRLGDMSKTTESCRPSSRDLLMVPLKFHNRDVVGGSAPVLNKSSSREVLTPLQGNKGTGRVEETSSPSVQICKTPTNGLAFHKTPIRDRMASPCSQRSQQIHNGANISQSGRPSSRESIHHAKSSPGLINSSWDKGEDEGVAADGSLSPYLDSTSNTDCGSLSKSSSDGDPVIFRKRPPTRLKSRRRNILSFPQLHLDDARLLQRRQDCYGGSSSDENRSSGHASMSDGHSSFISSSPTDCVLSRSHAKIHGNRYQQENIESNDYGDTKDLYPADQKILCRGTPLKAVPEDDRLSVATNRHLASVAAKFIGRRSAGYRKGTHRVREELLPVEGIAGLDDIRHAIEQLSAKNNNCRTSYSTSTYSSMSGSESESVRRLIRHSSLETINTNITSADEFVWIDSHSRLVELQHLPWSNHDVLRVIQTGRLAEHLSRISMETVPRLAYLLQRPLVRISREAQRFSRTLGMCSKQEISGALKVILSPAMADSCVKACLRSGAIYAVSGDQLKLSKSTRAGLQLSVGRFHRWMCDVRIGTFVHEYAAIYLTAALENLMEEVLLQCLPNDGESMLTASILESSIANNGDLWGLFQPYSHLNAGRTATGALSLPRWPNLSDSNSRFGSSSQLHQAEEPIRQTSCKSIEQNLLTTCVGSITELGDLLSRVVQYHNRVQNNSTGRRTIAWGPGALHSLYYFMRCSQLEHPDHICPHAPVQELIYERPYLVLPPLIEWVRVATAHTEYRRSYVVDKDDVMQAARLLLPGVDCPVRQFGICDEHVYVGKQTDESECAHLLKIDLAFRMLTSGRTDLIPHALQILPPSHVNTLNEHGLTPLMLACIRGDEAMVHMLMDAGADVDMETPSCSNLYPFANPETQHWTALTYATTHCHLSVIKLLLEKGANVEGGACLNEDKVTETPLQLSAASGRIKMVELLLSYNAHPFLSTTLRDSLSYSGAAQRGCYSAIAVAAAHGQRAILHKLLSHPMAKSNKDVLSLEEILAEGASQLTSDKRTTKLQIVPASVEEGQRSNNCGSLISDTSQVIKLNKTQLKALQEAMYHSAENGNLEITLDLRNIGVPWTLHCWMHTLATAHDLQLENIIDQLLQDFLHGWPEDCSSQFVDECLPLLFTIFRHSKKEGTSLLLADIFSTCYGKEPIKTIHDVSFVGGARIDPKYVNNPEMSDVQFRVEGRVFYAHKIILVNASPRFKSMLSSKCSDETPPVVQINDIRYDIFQLVMQYLYKGGCEEFDIDQNDVLELMAAAEFFQLDGLLRFCEAQSSRFVDLDNVVSMYVHAKVYSASHLLEFCQGFLLQNMVALLTYDDSVRKLIFGKKLHNHDVLSGLLLTLQARIKERSQGNKSSIIGK